MVTVVSLLRHQCVNHNDHLSLKSDFSYQIMKGFTHKSCNQHPNRYMWHLDPVTNPLLLLFDKNPLPSGNYRIRSFIGVYVLMTPEEENGRPYVRKQVQDNNAQEVSCLTMLPFCVLKFLFQWSVQLQSNGLYTIRNTGTQLYLAGSASNLVKGAPLIGQSTAFKWNILTFGPGVMFL